MYTIYFASTYFPDRMIHLAEVSRHTMWEYTSSGSHTTQRVFLMSRSCFCLLIWVWHNWRRYPVSNNTTENVSSAVPTLCFKFGVPSITWIPVLHTNQHVRQVKHVARCRTFVFCCLRRTLDPGLDCFCFYIHSLRLFWPHTPRILHLSRFRFSRTLLTLSRADIGSTYRGLHFPATQSHTYNESYDISDTKSRHYMFSSRNRLHRT